MSTYVLFFDFQQISLVYQELGRLKNVRSRLSKKLSFQITVYLLSEIQVLGLITRGCIKYLARCKKQITLDLENFYNFVKWRRTSASYR